MSNNIIINLCLLFLFFKW